MEHTSQSQHITTESNQQDLFINKKLSVDTKYLIEASMNALVMLNKHETAEHIKMAYLDYFNQLHNLLEEDNNEV